MAYKTKHFTWHSFWLRFKGLKIFKTSILKLHKESFYVHEMRLLWCMRSSLMYFHQEILLILLGYLI